MLGRFLTEDPVAGDPQNPPSLHKYTYAFQNPTVYVDPDGRIPGLKWVKDKLGEGKEALIDLAEEVGAGPQDKSWIRKQAERVVAERIGYVAGAVGAVEGVVSLVNTTANFEVVRQKAMFNLDYGFVTDQAMQAAGKTLEQAEQAITAIKEDPYGVAAEVYLSAEETVDAAARGDTRATAEVSAFATEVVIDILVGGKGAGSIANGARRGVKVAGEVAEEVVEASGERAVRTGLREAGEAGGRAADDAPIIRPGDRLPDGRIAGDGPGAALRDWPDFAGERFVYDSRAGATETPVPGSSLLSGICRMGEVSKRQSSARSRTFRAFVLARTLYLGTCQIRVLRRRTGHRTPECFAGRWRKAGHSAMPAWTQSRVS